MPTYEEISEIENTLKNRYGQFKTVIITNIIPLHPTEKKIFCKFCEGCIRDNHKKHCKFGLVRNSRKKKCMHKTGKPEECFEGFDLQKALKAQKKYNAILSKQLEKALKGK